MNGTAVVLAIAAGVLALGGPAPIGQDASVPPTTGRITGVVIREGGGDVTCPPYPLRG